MRNNLENFSRRVDKENEQAIQKKISIILSPEETDRSSCFTINELLWVAITR